MPKGRPAISGERKYSKIEIALTDSEKSELDTAATKIGQKTSTWARDELLRLAREINGPVTKKPAGKKPQKKMGAS